MAGTGSVGDDPYQDGNRNVEGYGYRYFFGVLLDLDTSDVSDVV